jgi:hypothetical protein
MVVFPVRWTLEQEGMRITAVSASKTCIFIYVLDASFGFFNWQAQPHALVAVHKNAQAKNHKILAEPTQASCCAIQHARHANGF